jgi:hypothetical protein
MIENQARILSRIENRSSVAHGAVETGLTLSAAWLVCIETVVLPTTLPIGLSTRY